jgi:hypothetical protein
VLIAQCEHSMVFQVRRQNRTGVFGFFLLDILRWSSEQPHDAVSRRTINRIVRDVFQTIAVSTFLPSSQSSPQTPTHGHRFATSLLPSQSGPSSTPRSTQWRTKARPAPTMKGRTSVRWNDCTDLEGC